MVFSPSGFEFWRAGRIWTLIPADFMGEPGFPGHGTTSIDNVLNKDLLYGHRALRAD